MPPKQRRAVENGEALPKAKRQEGAENVIQELVCNNSRLVALMAASDAREKAELKRARVAEATVQRLRIQLNASYEQASLRAIAELNRARVADAAVDAAVRQLGLAAAEVQRLRSRLNASYVRASARQTASVPVKRVFSLWELMEHLDLVIQDVEGMEQRLYRLHPLGVGMVELAPLLRFTGWLRRQLSQRHVKQPQGPTDLPPTGVL